MRIMILGAGRVGESVAETLASEANDITVVDPDPDRLHELEDRIELRGFGVFQVKPRKRGIGRNPRTGKEVRIPPGRTIRFKPGKDLQNLGQ